MAKKLRMDVPHARRRLFTANESFDIGIDSYSSVSQAYFDRAPFKFNGIIDKVRINYLQ